MQAFLTAMAVLVLEALAVVNAYIVNLKGATVDAERFLADAREWALHGQFVLTFDAEFYVQLVGVIFMTFGESEFLVAQLNIIALAVGCYYFHATCRLLVGRSNAYLTLPFMLWPSMLTRSTTAMREPLLILALVLVVYFLVRHLQSGMTSDLVRSLTVLAVGALLHKAFAVLFIAFGASTVIMSGILRARKFSVVDLVKRVILLASLAAVVGLVLQRAGSSRGLMPLVAALSSDTDQIERIVDWKKGRAFRTTYDASINVSSPAALVASLPKNWLFYNFTPFPWQISNALDVYAAIESLFRAVGFAALLALFLRHPEWRRSLLAILLVHVALMAIWAAGTANYGTASRHHLTTNWLFLLYLLVYKYRGTLHEGNRSRRRYPQDRHDMALRELPARS